MNADLWRLMDEALAPGAALATIRNGRLDEIASHGVRGIQSPLRVDDRIVFEAASLSKPLFGYLVLQLVDRGELKLEVPLNNYIPNYIADDPCSRSITVEHVLRFAPRHDPALRVRHA